MFGAPVFATVYYATRSREDRHRLDFQAGSVGRFLRSAWVGALVAVHYKVKLRGLKEGDPGYEEAASKVHREAAEMVRDGCLRNGGLYVKLGQGLAAMNHILPAEYVAVMSYLNDKALTRPES